MFAHFHGQINNLFPADRCCNLHNYIPLFFSKVIVKNPLKDVMLNFTDGSSNGRAAYIIVNGKKQLWSMPMAP